MKVAFVFVLCGLVAACSDTRFDQFSLEGGDSARMDASQRVILATNRGGRDGNRHVVCAEPSPDAVASQSLALTSQLAAKVTPPEGTAVDASASLSLAQAQSAAYVGMRTQTIQLLRDGLYRACEAYMNGAIDDSEYNMLLINMPRVMTALIAIDGLTGRPAAPAVVLSAPSLDASATPGEKAELAAKVVAAESKFADAAKTTALADAREATAVAEIAKAMASHPTMPAICFSLLSRKQDTLDTRYFNDQGFRAVLDFCKQSFRANARKT
jgi:hypothetical protein